MTQLFLVLKGMAMGAANVIPGVSGGTIAFITGIYERLIHALKSIDLQALKLFFTGRWKDFGAHIDFQFLFWLFLGVGISILSLAKLLEWALTEKEALTLAFFFGLILASILGVGRQVSKWNPAVIISFIFGCGIAVSLAFLPPATPNDSFIYLILCGAVAVCSMILPGLSGSYILLLMGNYALVLGALGDLNIGIIAPVMIGVLIGLIAFSRLLSWLFSKFKDQTISLLTGFVLGSLLIIWPWKETKTEIILGEAKAIGYDWILPAIDSQFFLALGLMLIGFVIVWVLDKRQSSHPA